MSVGSEVLIAGVALLLVAAGMALVGLRSLRASPAESDASAPTPASIAHEPTVIRNPLSPEGVSAASRLQAFLDDVLDAAADLRDGELDPSDGSWAEEVEHLAAHHFVTSPTHDVAAMIHPLVAQPFEPLVSGVMEVDDDAQAGLSHGGAAPHLDIRLRRGEDGWRIARIAVVDTDPVRAFTMTPLAPIREPASRQDGAALRPLRDALACFEQGVVLDIGMLPIPAGSLAVAPLPSMLWIHRYLTQFATDALRVRAAATEGEVRGLLISVPGGRIARWTPAQSADPTRHPVVAGQVLAFADPGVLAGATAWKAAHAVDGRDDQSLWLTSLETEGDALLCRLPTHGYVGYLGSEADGQVVALLVVPTGGIGPL